MPLYANTSLRFSLPLYYHQQQPLPSKVRVEYSCGSVEYTTACSTEHPHLEKPTQLNNTITGGKGSITQWVFFKSTHQSTHWVTL